MRPMPYTPFTPCQCEPMGRWTLVRWCPIHCKRIEPTKKLTDAECAAEYWRVDAELVRQYLAIQSGRSPDEFDRCAAERETWYRFATHPHASEADQ